MTTIASTMMTTIAIEKHTKSVGDILEVQNDFVTRYDLTFRNPAVLRPQNLAITWLQKGQSTLNAGFIDVSIDIMKMARDLQNRVLFNICRHGSGRTIIEARNRYDALIDPPLAAREKILAAQDCYKKAIDSDSFDVSMEFFSEAIRLATEASNEVQSF